MDESLLEFFYIPGLLNTFFISRVLLKNFSLRSFYEWHLLLKYDHLNFQHPPMLRMFYYVKYLRD